MMLICLFISCIRHEPAKCVCDTVWRRPELDTTLSRAGQRDGGIWGNLRPGELLSGARRGQLQVRSGALVLHKNIVCSAPRCVSSKTKCLFSPESAQV